LTLFCRGVSYEGVWSPIRKAPDPLVTDALAAVYCRECSANGNQTLEETRHYCQDANWEVAAELMASTGRELPSAPNGSIA